MNMILANYTLHDLDSLRITDLPDNLSKPRGQKSSGLLSKRASRF